MAVPSYGRWRLMALQHAEDTAPTVVNLSAFHGAKRATYREPKATEPPAKRRPLSPISDSNAAAFCASARGYLDDGDDEGYDHEEHYDVHSREWF